MGTNADLALRMALRDLRLTRNLGLEEASRRTGIAKATLSAWENGTRRPRGPALARHLGTLGADPRTKARLVHLADPQQARIASIHSPLGDPVHVGMALRVMRTRRGLAQADLARAIGVSQAAVSKWEVGDAAPSVETIHAIGFALGASAEETLALASVAGVGGGALSNDPEAVCGQVWSQPAPSPLREIVLLGWEAELRRRAGSDASWDAPFVALLAARTHLLVCEERYEEIAPLARRATALATTRESRTMAVPAISALADADRHLRRGPRTAARLAEHWDAGWPESLSKAWNLRQAGMSHIRMGDTAGGLERVARSAEMDLRVGPDHPEPWSHRATMLLGAYLEAGEPRRAAALLDGRRERHLAPTIFIAVEHANGRAATEVEMAYLRLWTANRAFTPLDRRRLGRIERRQTALTGHAPLGITDPTPGDPDAENRLWAAVLRGNRG